MKALDIGLMRIDGGTQPRAHLNETAVAEYAESLTEGAKLPAVTVYFDGSEYWLADGFHRYFAHKKIGALKIDADVRTGSCRDAVLHSVGANASHGLRRTNEDKHRAVQTLLNDEEWSAWTDREIAKICGVSHPFVAAVRKPEIASRQQSNRDKSSAKRIGRVESDSTTKIDRKESIATVAETPPVLATQENSDEYPDDGPSESELALFEEMEKAKQSAFDSVAEIAESDDKLASALQRIATLEEDNARLRAEVRVVKESRDSHMNAKNEAIRMVKSLQSKLKKLEKAAV